MPITNVPAVAKGPTEFGVDTGGTFTDVVRVEADGTFSVQKLLSTPRDPSVAILAGMKLLGATRRHRLVHGTTVATNAVLERRGARVAFVTNAGFEDLLLLRRQNRPSLYAQDIVVPRPVTCMSFGVDSRLDHRGAVVTEFGEAEKARLGRWAASAQVDAFAIVLLHAYANPEHERQVADVVSRARPDAFVSVSHEILNEFREYERATTTAVNAYVGPVMSRYFAKLRSESKAERIEIMQSNGGRCALEFAVAQPVQTVLSGPAGGVIGASKAAQDLDVIDVITFDMGGTSTDVCLVKGAPSWTAESKIDGLPIRIPVVDIYTVGAGGGSVGYVDQGGALRVGPRSSGASPGPAAYGNGGPATVTDAHMVLGRLIPDRFLGGEMALDLDASTSALEALASKVGGVDVIALADGILRIAEAAMSRAIKVISIERGHDTREFALVSFGGAGGLHACALAESLEIPRVIVPANPGLLSAVGMLAANATRVSSVAVLRPLEQWLEAAPTAPTPRPGESLRVEADLRYRGQSFEITLVVEPRLTLGDRFEQAHEKLYGYQSERQIEVVAVRTVRERPAAVAMTPRPPGDSQLSETRPAWFGAWLDTQVVERIGMSGTVVGPAIITEYSGTTVVPPHWRARPTDFGHLVLERA